MMRPTEQGFEQTRARRGFAWLGAVGKGRMRVIASLERLLAGFVVYGRFVVAPF